MASAHLFSLIVSADLQEIGSGGSVVDKKASLFADEPLVQIVLAVFNGADYLVEQVESLVNQSYQNIEILISDDGSYDGSVGIIDQYCSADSRIRRLYSGRRFGSASGHFMWLLTKTDARYVMFCDQDDVWDADKVANEMEKMLEMESDYWASPILVHSDLRVVNSELTLINSSYMAYQHIDPARVQLRHLLAQNVVTGCTALLNRRLVDLVSATVGNPNIIMHDRWVALVASALGKIGYVPAATVSYRQHESNSIGAHGFSVRDKLSSWESVVQSVCKGMQQANALLLYFETKMSDADYSACARYGSIYLVGGKLQRILELVRSGCWMFGFRRKMAQIVAVAMINSSGF